MSAELDAIRANKKPPGHRGKVCGFCGGPKEVHLKLQIRELGASQTILKTKSTVACAKCAVERWEEVWSHASPEVVGHGDSGSAE